ncbi:tape measure protein [Actinomyces faecalis]|uniref:tape measure protein n=1 Tax=Actinomyces faecalis TaxID=2722820 RepID=UPI0015557CFF|nr:tape measure protein [Actinomyces faecalis]
MAGAFQAGTVFVDVVPSLKGFYKTVSNETRTAATRAGGEAGKACSDSFTKSATTAGKDVANALTDPLGKSTERLRTEAATAGQALASAQETAARSTQTLTDARTKEAEAASKVQAAEKALATARASGNADDVARAETALASATKDAQAAFKAADTAAAAHSKALGEVELKTRAADAANDALAASEGRQGAEARQAGRAAREAAEGIEKMDRAADSADGAVRRSGTALGSFRGLVRQAMGPLAALGAAIGIGGLASEAMDASDATDKFKSTLRFADVDTSTIEALAASTKKYADETVYELSDIQSITSQLASNGVDGYDRLAEAAGNLNAVAGGNADTFKSVGMVLTQTAGQGKLTTENFNQLSDAIPGASGKIQQALAEAGAYTGNFRDAMAEGQITAEEFNQAILALGMTDVAREAATSTSTMEGAWGNFQATLVSGVKDIIEDVKPALTSGLSAMSDAAGAAFAWVQDTLVPALQSAWESVGPMVSELASVAGGVVSRVPGIVAQVVQGLEDLFSWASRNRDVLAPLGVALGVAAGGLTALVAAHRAHNAVMAAGGLLRWVKGLSLFTKATNIAKAAQAAFNVVMNLNPLGLIVTAITAVVAGVVWFATQTDTGRAVVAAAWQAIKDAVAAVVDWFRTTLVPVLSTVWEGVKTGFTAVKDTVTAVWDAIMAAVQTVVGWFQTWVLPVIELVGAMLTAPFLGLMVAVKAAWNGIMAGVRVVVGWFQTWVLPVISFVIDLYVAYFNLLKTVVLAVWNGIMAGVRVVVAWFQAWVWPAISAVIDWVSAGFTAMKDSVATAWNAVRTAVEVVKNWFTGTLWPAISGVIDNVKTGFENMKTAVATAWDGIKAAAAKPINFVIGTVYTDGIKKTFDTIAEKVGLSIRMPSVSKIPGYATGGQFRTMTPGYTPGKDVYTFYSPDGGGALRLSGGEGIIRPDALRALGGRTWLDAVNASRGRGLSTVGDGGARRGQVAFAEGGIWDRVRGSASAAWSWVKDTASAVADIVSDPLGAITDLVISPARTLLSSLTSTAWGQIAAGIPPMLFEGIKSIFKTKVDESGIGGGAGLVGAARRAIGVPYVWGGSSIPPGLDCSGLVYWAAQQLGLGWPRLTAAGYQSGSTPVSMSQAVPGDLLFWGSPAHHVAIYSGPGRMVEEPREGLSGRETAIWGSPTVGRYRGSRKYDAGGWLHPGLTTAVNHTGQREAVLTARQWDDISTLATRGTDNPLASLDGVSLQLVLDDGTSLAAHLEATTTRLLATRRSVTGRRR